MNHERDRQSEFAVDAGAGIDAGAAARRDWLELLLPGPAEAARREKAERLLDALASWTLPNAATPQPIDLPAARALVRDADVEEAARLVEVVLAATAGAILPADTYASWWKHGAVARPAWARLSGLAARQVDLPSAPAPGEAPTRIVRRLQVWLERHAPVVAETWSVRTTWALENASAAFERWEQRYGRGTLGLRPFSQRVACLVDGVELCLELGRPELALDLLRRHPTERAADARLVQRLAWCAFAIGDEGAAAEAWSEAPRERLVWPEPIAALRRRLPAAQRVFEGRAASGVEPSDLRPLPASKGERAEIGAVRLAFVAPRRGGHGFVVVHQEGVSGVLAAREGQRLVDPTGPSCSRLERALHSGALQFEFMESDAAPTELEPLGPKPTESTPSEAHPNVAKLRGPDVARTRTPRTAGDARSGTPARVRAAVAVPLPAEGPRGVLWIEFPHRLVPTDERLRVFTAAAVRRALPHFDVHRVDGGALAYVAEGSVGAETPRAASARAAWPESDAAVTRFADVDAPDPRRLFAEALAAELPEAWRARPWWVVGAGLEPFEETEQRSERASSLEVWGARRPAPASLDALRSEQLARCFDSTAPVLCEDLAPQHALSSGARVRAVVPLVLGTRVAALFVVEAQRRGELSASVLGRIALQVRSRGAGAFWAEVARRHAQRFGETFVGEALGLARPERLVELAREPVVGVCGARGSGKALVARCLHVVGGSGAFVDFGHLRPPRWREQLEARLSGTGTVLVRHVDRADPRVQTEFVQQALEHERNGRGGARLVWTAGGDELVPALRGRVALELAPLASRRVRVPALASALFERALAAAGTASGRTAARLDDSALALLWRAPWRNGVHDLARLIVEIATGRPRPHYGGSDVERAAGALGIALLERFDSRQPPRELLVDAIATTALPNGRANQRRAALYLGWDRDTLRLRLRDAGMLDACANESASGATSRRPSRRDTAPRDTAQDSAKPDPARPDTARPDTASLGTASEGTAAAARVASEGLGDEGAVPSADGEAGVRNESS